MGRMNELSDYLAGGIKERMDELGMSPTDLSELTGLSLTALANLRRGERRSYQTRLTAPVTAALRWTPDSIQRLLDGLPAKPLPGLSATVEPITRLIREATGGDRLGKEGKLTEFAKAIGTTPTTVGRWRDGVIPGPRWRSALADYFGVTEEEIDDSSGVDVTLELIAAKLDDLIVDVRANQSQGTQVVEMVAELTKLIAEQAGGAQGDRRPAGRGRRAAT